MLTYMYVRNCSFKNSWLCLNGRIRGDVLTRLVGLYGTTTILALTQLFEIVKLDALCK